MKLTSWIMLRGEGKTKKRRDPRTQFFRLEFNKADECGMSEERTRLRNIESI
jgi:hypothetical protein